VNHVAELFNDLAECMVDSSKKATTPSDYQGDSEEAATLRAMATKVWEMSAEKSMEFLLEVEPIERRDALLRLGIKTGVLVLRGSVEDDDD